MALSTKQYSHFDIGDQCWVISDCGVMKSTVVSVEIDVNFMATTIVHYCRIEDETGQIPVTPEDIFPDVTSALAEYQIRITA